MPFLSCTHNFIKTENLNDLFSEEGDYYVCKNCYYITKKVVIRNKEGYLESRKAQIFFEDTQDIKKLVINK